MTSISIVNTHTPKLTNHKKNNLIIGIAFRLDVMPKEGQIEEIKA